MANSVTVKIEGLDKLGAAMKDLGFEVQNKLSRAAVRGASNLVRDTVRSLAPVGVDRGGAQPRKAGALRDAIGVRRDTKNSYPGFEVMAVGVFSKGGSKDKNSPQYYWKFPEFGTIKMAAEPFLRPGYDEDKSSAAEKMANVLAVGIEKKTAGYK